MLTFSRKATKTKEEGSSSDANSDIGEVKRCVFREREKTLQGRSLSVGTKVEVLIEGNWLKGKIVRIIPTTGYGVNVDSMHLCLHFSKYSGLSQTLVYRNFDMMGNTIRLPASELSAARDNKTFESDEDYEPGSQDSDSSTSESIFGVDLF